MIQDESVFSRSSSVGRKATWSKTELLDLITRSAGATMAMVDRSLTLIYVNQEYARWFHTVPDQLIGKTLADVYGERECARFMPFVDRVLLGERVQYQRMLRTPYGVDEWRTMCLTPWHDGQGAVQGFVTTALDVHELQVAINALRDANQRLSSHMKNSPLAVLEMDHQLKLLHGSQRAVQLMGCQEAGPLQGACSLSFWRPIPSMEACNKPCIAFSRVRSRRTVRRAAWCAVTARRCTASGSTRP